MNTSMNLQRISVDRLKPAKYNPRKDLKPGDPAYEKIKRSLHEFGYVDPVIWNEVTGNIEGATEIDCVVVHIENPQEEKALNIALNKAVGEWEPVALADLLNDLKLSGYDVDATGFDAAEIDDLFHAALLSACPNVRLVEMARASCATISKYLYYQYWITLFTPKEFYDRHLAIAKAADEGNAASIERILRDHYRENGIRMSELVHDNPEPRPLSAREHAEPCESQHGTDAAGSH